MRERILQWRKIPRKFIEDTIDISLSKDQLKVFDALSDNRFIAIKSGHGVGKTGLLSLTILWFLTCYTNCRIACTAPTADQLIRILWPEIYKWIQKSKLKDWYVWQKEKVYVKGEENKCFAYYKTARTQEALAGIHEDNIMYILEEASGIEDPIWEPIEGALTTNNARVIIAGNPTRPKGNFYKAFTSQSKFYKTFTFSSENSSLVSPEYTKRQEEKYGRDSDIFRVRVLGEFPKQTSDVMIPLYLCEESLMSEVQIAQRLKMGVDVARFGSNYTVWVIRNGGQIVHLEREQTMDTMSIAGKTLDLQRQFGIAGENVYIDAIGVGGGVVDRLNEQDIGVIGVNVGLDAVDPEQFGNRRVEMWQNVRDALKNKELNLTIGNDPGLIEDLCGELASPTYKFTSKGQKQLESKEDMRKRGVQSPDMADALVLTYYANNNVDFVPITGSGISYPKDY